jgi:LPS-assembly protein
MLVRRPLTVPVMLLTLAAAAPARAQSATGTGNDAGVTVGQVSQQRPGSPARPPGRRRATERAGSQPALVTADQIVHDRDLNTVTASGHVEVDQGGRFLLADNLSYNLKQDVIIATGNVSLTDTDGTVTFADYFELTGDMKTSVTQAIRVLEIDDSRIAGARGRRVVGDRSVFQKALYTACRPCAKDPSQPPVWVLKAERVTDDEVEHIIKYNDAWLEFEGIPVVYSPYFQHADPTVKRESGLLPPGVLSNRVIGSGVRTSYFQVIDPYQDITLSPMITSSNYDMLAVTHRWRGEEGESKTVASVTSEPVGGRNGGGTIGWHVDAYSLYDISDTWRAGYQIQRASDQNYLESFGYHPSLPYLTTRPYLEGFDETNYAAIEGYSFQSLVTQTPPAGAPLTPKIPVVFPLATYSYVGRPGDRGGYWTFDSQAAVISREEGTDSRRINTQTSWHLPYVAADGEVYHLTASVRGDGYNSNDLTPQSTKMVNAERALPSVTLDWRYPFTKLGDHSSQTISPIVVATASPYGGNSNKIPNEDSLDFELDDSNIFKPNPGAGYDRILSVPRVAYGVEYSVVNRGVGATNMLLAQSYQVHNESVFPQGSGLDHHLSDIVGRVNFTPSGNFSIQDDFRLDEDKFTLRRNEITSNFGPRPLNLQTSYVFYDRLSPNSPFLSREQIIGTLVTQMTHYWSTQVYRTQNLGVGAGPLQTGMRVVYEDECLQVVSDAGSNHTTSKVFSVGHYLMLRIVLKTLGQFPVDVF